MRYSRQVKTQVNFLAVVGLIWIFHGTAYSANTVDAESPLVDIVVSYKLDPRLTRANYMGDRWVSPPKYTSTLQPGEQAIIEARVYGRDHRGISMAISPKWIVSDREMVKVQSGQGGVFTLIINRTGRSRLSIQARGISKELIVEAVRIGAGMQVIISNSTER